MNRDDIIRMAVKCQLMTTANREGVYVEALERFAELVAAAERETCAKVCEDDFGNGALNLANAIRARGTQ